jgi:hypothetical protein
VTDDDLNAGRTRRYRDGRPVVTMTMKMQFVLVCLVAVIGLIMTVATIFGHGPSFPGPIPIPEPPEH